MTEEQLDLLFSILAKGESTLLVSVAADPPDNITTKIRVNRDQFRGLFLNDALTLSRDEFLRMLN